MMNSATQADELIDSFNQETRRIANACSVNIPTHWRYKNQVRKGWINLTHLFRGTMILGAPGTGKTETFVQNFVHQLLEKEFTMAIYDYKSPELSRLAYTHYIDNLKKTTNQSGVSPSFHAINFTDPRYSSRCNPFLAERFTNSFEALEAAKNLLYNVNRSWSLKGEGDFFVEVAINYLTACIWYMKRYNDRQEANYEDRLPTEERAAATKSNRFNYCTLPHIIEFATRPTEEIIPLLKAEPELAHLMEAITNIDANDTREHMEGLLKVMQLSLSTLKNPVLYWIMTGSEALVDINNPSNPKILCLGNDPASGHLFSVPLALISHLLAKQVNHPHQRPSALIFDEFPTLYLSEFDSLLATARFNKIALCLSVQDLTQLENKYGKVKAQALFTMSGTILAGQVRGTSAQQIADRLTKRLETVKPSKSWSFFVKPNATQAPRISSATLNALPYGCFAGEVATQVDAPPTHPVFFAQVTARKAKLAENLAELPINPELAMLTDQQLGQRLNDHMAAIQQEVTVLLQQERQRHKLR
ncbi:type IV secretion system DNA-binding domain-containing protein [Spirosoma horti]